MPPLFLLLHIKPRKTDMSCIIVLNQFYITINLYVICIPIVAGSYVMRFTIISNFVRQGKIGEVEFWYSTLGL